MSSNPWLRIGSLSLVLGSTFVLRAEVNQVTNLALGVFFHEGDLKGRGHCNNGWIVFEDFVLVIDANFPSGAREVIPKIKSSTSTPIRFAFDTHHHGDHAYGNMVWVENGAIPVAHAGVVEEMMKYETGFYAGQPGRWENEAKNRPDVAASKLKPPALLYTRDMVFDDGRQRVELLHFGVAHTRGDGWAWLPKEKILFTGDACVNGPYNFAGDGDIGQWIKTLEAAQKLQPRIVCPGHGPVGTGQVLEDQRRYFIELQKQVKNLVGARKKPADSKAAIEAIRTALTRNERIARYVGDFLPAQVDKVHRELTGKPLLPASTSLLDERHEHAQAHGSDVR